MKNRSLILIAILFSISSFAKAKPGFDPKICWDRVIEAELSWPNGCKGKVPEPGDICTEALVPLTPDELKQYQAWIAAKRPHTPCQTQK